jgi:two-component system, cell cycle sensor histidine kinase and response regulator CckA
LRSPHKGRFRLSHPLPRTVTTILVVDDERMSRQVASRLLSEEGYRLLEADGAHEALAVLSQARGRVDLLLLDVVMPGCDGVTLGRQVLERWPDQPILYMSAHPAEVVRHGLPTLDLPFLPKPYTRDEALTKVREALERRRSTGVRDDPP